MPIFLLIALVFIIAIINSTMNPIQARNGQTLGVYWATTVYLVIGTAASLVWMLVVQEYGLFQNYGQLPYYVFINGLYNVFVLVGIITLLPKVGVGTTWAFAVVGQFSAALIYDHFGLFGLAVTPLSIEKLAAVAVIIGGSLLFTRGRRSTSTGDPLPGSQRHWPAWAAMTLGIGIGCSYPLMSIINARAGQIIGISGTVVLYLGLGAVLSLVISLIYQPHIVAKAVQLPFYAYLPGIINLLIVALPATLIPMLGVGIYTAVGFLAHSLASMIIDSIGIWDMPKIPISTNRVMGTVIMLAGVLVLRLATT